MTATLTPTEPCYLITDAGMEALRTAVTVPDDDQGEDDFALVPDDGTERRADAFTPDTKEKCDWVLSKIADHRARAARIRENAEAMAREQDRQAEHLEWKYGAALQDFARRELAGGKRKSLTLYHGTLGFRTRPAGVAFTDDVAALSWAQENAPAAVVPRLDKKALGDVLKASGEVVNFATFTEPEEVFYIK